MLKSPVALIVLGLLAAAGCCPKRTSSVLTPTGHLPAIEWTQEERSREVALRPIRVTDTASYHGVLLSGSETPHVHERTDLTVVVLRGRVRMNLGDQVTIMSPGDTVDIARGVPHWAENLADGPSEAYLIASPPLNGTDTKPIH